MESEPMTAQPVDSPHDLVASIPANIPNTQTIEFYTENTKKARSYAGHADVDSTKHPRKKNHLFYWFFESQSCCPDIPVEKQQKLIDETPLLIWLNGGPGASSLPGLFLENGPLSIGTDAAGTVSVTATSWNEEAHVLFWDQPIGAGYSYTDVQPPKDEYVTDEATLSQMFCAALQEFFRMHPEYAKCPLYVCGESYAGKYVPAIALEIDKQNMANPPTHINLKGIAVGNGWIKPELSIRTMIDYLYAAGFLGVSQKSTLDSSYDDFVSVLRAKDMTKATELGNALIAKTLAYGGNPYIYDIRRWDDLPMGALAAYLDSDSVRTAMHVPAKVKWEFADNSGPVAENLVKDIMADCTAEYTEIIDKKYKTLLYTGNFDAACGYLTTETFLDDLMKKTEWSKAPRLIWAQAQGNPKGFVRRYQKDGKDLTQVSVPDSGHEVPAYQPWICREMLYNWLFDRRFAGYDPEDVTQANGHG
jgi:carboxypeptidase C (cathepsin A)